MSDSNPWQLTPAQIVWSESGEPVSEIFGDIYFSRGDGLAETQYVFLQQNQLEQRWRALDPVVNGVFVIGETGFGTGLNFFCTWDLWRRVAPPNWRLLFISVERYPLDPPSFARAQQQWPQFAALSAQVLASYPPLLPGFQRRHYGDRVELQLLFDDAAVALAALHDSAAPELPNGFHIDAWFLDGFAPAKNPEMWHDSLFQQIGKLSRSGTTFATFTVAGDVKRGMHRAGFAIEKFTGFGAKRQMLRGAYVGNVAAENTVTGDAELISNKSAKLRAIEYWAYAIPDNVQSRRVVVIGGGLAGAHTARALAMRGWPVTLLEQADALASGASGNPQGVLYTKLSPQAGMLNRFTLASYCHALEVYRALPIAENALGDFCGVLQLADSAEQWQQLQTVFAGHGDWVQFVDAEQTSAIAQCPVPQAALWFPRAGWLDPAAICRRLVDHPLIEIRTHCRVTALHRDGQQWNLETSVGNFGAAIVVIATANDATTFAPTAHLPLKPIRGQITQIPQNFLRYRPRCVICHDGYLIADAFGLSIGATFAAGDSDLAVRASDHLTNIQTLQRELPELLTGDATAIAAAVSSGRAGLRCTTPDYLPLVGAVADKNAMRAQFATLAKNAQATIAQPGIYLPNLYVNVGHGSRGLTSTPLCAELLAAQISGEPRPVSRAMAQALSPARFVIRDLIRGY